jgi:glycosyltransferase involved in cell wall biosynthesis
VILDAVKSILAVFPRLHLLVVGDGPMRRAIETRVAELGLVESVIMAGYREDIADVIAAFDIAVMASYASEGIPQFALQAMASGKPVVATRVGGIPEVVLDGETGLLVEPKDPEGLARSVVELLKDSEGRRRMGERGRRRVASHHSFDRMLDQLEECYVRTL